MIRTQGQVKSIAVGGRSQPGPMQGDGATKGARVLTYEELSKMVLITDGASDGAFIPQVREISQHAGYLICSHWHSTQISGAYFNSFRFDPPLFLNLRTQRVGVRNNYRATNLQVPLHYTFDASDCRLFFTARDMVDVSNLWSRVARTAWGNSSCVAGSTGWHDATKHPGPVTSPGPGAGSDKLQAAGKGTRHSIS